jgi:hypothetical protein
MKDILIAATFISLFHTTGVGQTLNQISILPANPTSADSICIITDFTYYGSCTYGMVGVYASQSDTSLHIAPTYCGYGSDTLCNSIDTFKIGPFASGNYTMHIEFHQGSICPFSGFDALIYTYDTAITIGTTYVSLTPSHEESLFDIFPNPAHNGFSVSTQVAEGHGAHSLVVVDLLGRVVVKCPLTSGLVNINTSSWSKQTIYFAYIIDTQGVLLQTKRVLIQ